MNYEFPCPMKVWSSDDKDVVSEALLGDDYACQLKRDGYSYCLVKDETGTAHLYSGSISKKDGFPIDKVDNAPHIKRFIESFFKNESSLVAELWTNYNYSNGTEHNRELASYTNTIMLCGAAKAAQRQDVANRPLNCYVFDVLEWGGEDIAKKDFAERDAFLEDLFKIFPAYPWLKKAETIVENKCEYLQSVLADGCEGVVLKLMHSIGRWSATHPVVNIGETPKRPAHSTLKIKEVNTVDAVIMGVTWPDKEYKGKDPENYEYRDEENNPVNRLWALGMINAFIIGAYDDSGKLIEIGTIASGLDDEIRKDAADDYEKYYNRTVECTVMSIDKEGKSLRHPRLTRFRDDKPAEHCLMKDIFA